MDVVSSIIGMFKTNTKGLYKETIENLTGDWSGGPYLMLNRNSVVPWGRTLLSIGYKYNTQKFLYFIVTEDTWITKTGIPYLFMYPGQFVTFDIRPVDYPLVVSEFFGYFHEVYSYKKSRQSNLLLGMFWANQCYWIRLCTIVAMLIAISDCWKLFR